MIKLPTFYENNLTLSQTTAAEIDNLINRLVKVLQITNMNLHGVPNGVSISEIQGENDILQIRVFQAEDGRDKKQIYNYVNKQYLNLNAINDEYFDGVDKKFPIEIPQESNLVLLRNTSTTEGLPILTLSVLFAKESFLQIPFIKDVINEKAQRGTKEFISEKGDPVIGASSRADSGKSSRFSNYRYCHAQNGWR